MSAVLWLLILDYHSPQELLKGRCPLILEFFFMLFYQGGKMFKQFKLGLTGLMPFQAGLLSANPSWGFRLHWSAEQTALMRTQIPSCCIDLQNHCIGEGKSMAAKCPPSTDWPTGDLNKIARGLLTVGPSDGRGKRPHYHFLFCASNYLNVFFSPDSELLQGRSYTYSNKADCS